MFYILHGKEEFERSKELDRLREKLAEGDQAMAQLNTTIFDGKGLNLGELRHACDTVPFMYDRRLVIVRGLLGWLVPEKTDREAETPERQEPAWRRAYLNDLAAYLPALPETTRLVFVEEGELKASHPILKVAEKEREKGRAHIKLFKPPWENELPGWIQGHVQAGGGRISQGGIKRLVELVGNDLRLLDLEIDKLLLYADGRQVTEKDVDVLVGRSREDSIFELVDCVGRREIDQALGKLHHLLDDGEPALRLLGMLARQVRILIQVSELRSERTTDAEIAKRLKLHYRVAPKLIAQAQNFSMRQLEQAHTLVVETDWNIKTGEMEDVLALDMLVVALTRL